MASYTRSDFNCDCNCSHIIINKIAVKNFKKYNHCKVKL